MKRLHFGAQWSVIQKQLYLIDICYCLTDQEKCKVAKTGWIRPSRGLPQKCALILSASAQN